MKRFLVGLFAVIGVLALLFVAAVGGGIWYLAHRAAAEAPDRMVLMVDLRESLPGGARASVLRRALTDAPATLHDTIAAIDRAASDDRVAALVGVFGGDAFGLATAQELRAAVARFRASGKPTFAYADSLGEFGPANAAYYLATGFDEIWVQPVGTVGLTGIYATVPFAAEALESFGFEAAFARRGPYKTAPESLTERGFSAPHREMVESLTSDLYGQLVTGIAEGRGAGTSAVDRLVDDGPYLATDAQTAGLVDGLAHRDAFDAMVRRRAGAPTPQDIDPSTYLEATKAPAPDDAPGVAVIYANGLIAGGESEDDPLFGAVVMGADTVSDAIEGAIEDATIRAIVLRIDSGGGSAVASEVIGRAVERAAQSAKPIVVSMAETAASGGYWIAAYADAIIAQPATLTGSIGVFAGKIVSTEFWEDLGVNWPGVAQGDNAGMWASTVPYSRDEAVKVEALVDGLYEQFIARVAAGRGLPPDAVRRIAEGRVWTGAQALEIGLVDRLGGLDVALDVAREALDLPADAPLDVRTLPEPPFLLDEVLTLAGGQAAMPLGQLTPALRQLQSLIVPPGGRTLIMPPILVGGITP